MIRIKTVGFLGLFSGLAIGVPLIALNSLAQNPHEIIKYPLCPRVYYEEPWQSLLYPPTGCPPNEAMLSKQSQELYNPPQNIVPVAPSLSEERNLPIASIIPDQGTVNIQLNNSSDSIVIYEISGQTRQRQLNQGQKANLSNIPLPVMITVSQPETGSLKVIPVSSDSDALNITLEDNYTVNDINNSQGVIRIEKNGNVFLN